MDDSVSFYLQGEMYSAANRKHTLKLRTLTLNQNSYSQGCNFPATATIFCKLKTTTDLSSIAAWCKNAVCGSY